MFEDLPVIFVKDYSEVNEDNLNMWKNNFIKNYNKFNFEKLRCKYWEKYILSFLKDDSQYLINENIIDKQMKPSTISKNYNKIPKIIHKTFKTSYVSKSMKDAVMSWKKLNPEYEINFYDNEDCEDFLMDNFDEKVLNTYRMLIPGAYKADLFRFCILYIKGGIYSDIGQVCVNSLDMVINKDDEFISAKDIPDTCIQMSFICCVPQHVFIKKAIDKIIENVENKYNGENLLDITGPLMFGKVISKIMGYNEKKFKLGGDNTFKLTEFTGDGNDIIHNGIHLIQTKYGNYNTEKVSISNLPIYGILWKDKLSFNTYNKTPKIVHLIYMPWNKDQKLKQNPYDFDMSYANNLQKDNIYYDIKLWTLSKLKQFVNKYYKEYFNFIFNVQRPIMMVDILRILVLYHYGGIYIQYGSKILVNLDDFLPSNNKNVKLFTEIIISTEYSEKMKNEPIRNGKPEELVRVDLGFFSSVPRNLFFWYMFKSQINNIIYYNVKCDYDILYITGNSLISTIYDKIGKINNEIELIDKEKSNKMIKIKSNGSWRKK